MGKDRVEFYDDDKLVVGVDSSMVPRKGSYISIRKQLYKVASVTFAVDYADSTERHMCCNVALVKKGGA